jgi:hypothetical protein
LPELIDEKSTRQEQRRLQFPQIFLDETVCCMQETVNDHPSHFVFNLDEVGISEWEDRKSKKSWFPWCSPVKLSTRQYLGI